MKPVVNVKLLTRTIRKLAELYSDDTRLLSFTQPDHPAYVGLRSLGKEITHHLIYFLENDEHVHLCINLLAEIWGPVIEVNQEDRGRIAIIMEKWINWYHASGRNFEYTLASYTIERYKEEHMNDNTKTR